MNSLGGACIRAALAALTLTLCAAAAGAASTAKDGALVKKGEYLARAADCMPCHTGNRAQPYAGGLPIHTPFGILYSTNITSDPQTGIGNWTFADFREALHNGIRADGAFLYPAMPFDAYTKITEPDLEALWAYSQPAADPCPGPLQSARLPVRYPQRHAGMARALFSARLFPADTEQERRLESRRLSGRGACSLRGLPQPAQRRGRDHRQSRLYRHRDRRLLRTGYRLGCACQDMEQD